MKPKDRQIDALLRRISASHLEFDPDRGGNPLADVFQSNSLGEQALHLAAWHMEAVDIDLLLEHGAMIDEPGEQCMPPLGYALIQKRLSNVVRLLERGADPTLLPHGTSGIRRLFDESLHPMIDAAIAAGAPLRAGPKGQFFGSDIRCR